MTITIRRNPEDKLIELGGGARPLIHPNVDVRQCFDQDGQPTVDIVWDLSNMPWPLQDEEWDGVFSCFAMEHISYTLVPQFLREVNRICKPDAKVVLIVPNTEAQLRWVLEHPEGWDGNDIMEAASCLLYGDHSHSQREGEANVGADSHKVFLSPASITKLLTEAGFKDITIQPYGERATDMVVECIKSVDVKNTITIKGEREVKVSGNVNTPTEWETCNAVGPQGAKCSLPKGHVGNHKAEV